MLRMLITLMSDGVPAALRDELVPRMLNKIQEYDKPCLLDTEAERAHRCHMVSMVGMLTIEYELDAT